MTGLSPESTRIERALTPAARPPRAWPAFLLVLAAGIVLSALLTAPVHGLLMKLGWLSERDFLRVLRRLLTLSLAVALLSTCRPWRDGGLASYGLTGDRARVRPALLAALVTLGTLAALIAWESAMGWIAWDDPIPWRLLGPRAASALLGGVVVAVVEEWFFRGWMVRRLSGGMAVGWAAAISGLCYGAVHAFKNFRSMGVLPHDAAGAFAALGIWFSRMAEPAFLRQLAGLFLLGLLLTALYLRTGSLWPSIAVHAAAVAVLYSYSAVSNQQGAPLWAGTSALHDGWPAWALLALAAALLWPYRRRRA